MSKTLIITLVAAFLSLALMSGITIKKSNILATEVSELSEQIIDLKQQTQMNTDQAELTNLQAIYGYYVDKAQWNDAADLFTSDATLEIAGRGLFTSQESIRTYLVSRGGLTHGRLYNHMQLQPVIHIADDGLSAKARWRSFMQVGQLGEEARWGEATYNNEYEKQDGVWKIKKLHSFITFYVEYDQGWNKGAVVMPSQTDESAPTPDGDSTVRYGAFPEVYLPPYHYSNPVTGR